MSLILQCPCPDEHVSAMTHLSNQVPDEHKPMVASLLKAGALNGLDLGSLILWFEANLPAILANSKALYTLFLSLLATIKPAAPVAPTNTNS